MIIKIHKSISLTEKEQEALDFEALEETGFYGRKGAGAIIFCTQTKRYLLAHRSKSVEQPNTWGIWGGAIREDEKPLEAVKREMREELGLEIHEKPVLIYIFKSGSFSYWNYRVDVSKEFKPHLNWETQGYGWFAKDDFPEPLHFGVQALLDQGAI